MCLDSVSLREGILFSLHKAGLMIMIVTTTDNDWQ